MLSIEWLSLIGALRSGVFGFAADGPPDQTWEKGSIVLPAAAGGDHLRRKHGSHNDFNTLIRSRLMD